jgi:hypothetical protein
MQLDTKIVWLADDVDQSQANKGGAFVTKVSMSENAFDRTEYQKADLHFRLAKEELPQDAISSLAREVVRRLAFKMPHAVKKEDLPTPSDIELLCSALLSRKDDAADNFVLAARRDGVDLDYHLMLSCDEPEPSARCRKEQKGPKKRRGYTN